MAVAVLHLRPRPPNLPRWRFLSSGVPAGGGADDNGGGGGGGGGAEEPVRKLGVLLQSGRFQASLTLAKALIRSNKTLIPSPFHLYQPLSLSFPSPIPSAASLLVAACAHLKLPEDGLHLVSHVTESRHPFPSLTSCNFFLETLISLGRYSDAQSLFSQIVASGTSPVTFTYNKLMQSKVKSGDVNGALALLDQMERTNQLKPNAFTYNVLISGLWKERRGMDAVKLFDKMLERRIAPTQVTFNTMVDGYCKAGNLDAAFGLRDQMLNAGFKPNMITYNALISVLCRAAHMEECRRVLEEMEANGLVPDGFTHSILLDDHAKCGNSEMARKGVKIGDYTCSILLNRLCKDGKVSKAEEVLERLVKKGMVPITVMYNAIVDGHCQVGDLEAAFSAVRRMELHGLKTNCITYNSLVNGLCKLQWMAEAEELVMEMGKNGVAPSAETYNILVDAYGRAGQFERCLEILDEIQEKMGLKPNVVSYGSLVNGLCKKGKLLEAEAIFHDMVNRKISPSVQVYNMLIGAYCAVGKIQKARALIEDMKRRGISPSIVTYNALVKGLCKEGRISEAEELTLCLEDEGLMPDVVMCNIMISEHCNMGDTHRALQVYEEMKLGIKPTLITYPALISAMCNEG